MRLKFLAGALFLSSPAVAIEPLSLPRLDDNGAAPIPAASFVSESGVVAEGVPVEAVLGGEEPTTEWVARSRGAQAALDGLDPVTFFEPGGPKAGRPELSAEYHGGVFYFTDKRHRELFVNAPDAFAPAFGGYDPELLARGALLPADPENWTIFDGRLFLSGSPTLKDEFDKHKPEVIKAAQEKWKAVDEMFEDRFFKAHQD